MGSSAGSGAVGEPLKPVTPVEARLQVARAVAWPAQLPIPRAGAKNSDSRPLVELLRRVVTWTALGNVLPAAHAVTAPSAACLPTTTSFAGRPRATPPALW